MSPTTFLYKATDRSGRERKGKIGAPNEAEAVRRLHRAGFEVAELRVEGGKSLAGRGRAGGRISSEQIAGLARELSVLLEAGIPLGRGLAAIADNEPNEALRTVVRQVAASVEAGQPLTDALGAHRHAFSDVFIETVRSAERSGELRASMLHLADLLERQIVVQQQLRKALTYPVIVLAVVAIAMAVIIVFVVPRFAQTFASQGIDLPLATVILRDFGASVRAHWWAYATGLFLCVLGFRTWVGSSGGRLTFERIMLRTPYLRAIIEATTAARFVRVLGVALGAGVEIVDAVEMAGRATGRPLFVAETRRMASGLRTGKSIGEILQGNPLLPGFARRMLGAGKDSAELSKTCAVIARHYDRQSDHLTSNVTTIIEPVLTVLMAAVVLVIALSVFLPMWSVIGSQGG
ncbi:MAG: type II secretion system F family protein [Planctomycetota bacterium]